MAEPVATKEIINYIDGAAPRFGVSADTAKRFFLAENMERTGKIPPSIDPDTTSSAGAYGPMQVIPATYEGLKKNGYLPADHSMTGDWRKAVDAGIVSIKAMQKQHGTTDPNILAAAYQGGNKAAEFAKSGEFDRLPAGAKDYQNRISLAGTILGSNKSTAPAAAPADTSNAVSSATSRAASQIREVDNAIAKSDDPPATAEIVNQALGTDKPSPGTNVTTDKAASAFADIFANTKTVMDGLITDITRSSDEEVAAKKRAATQIEAAGQAAGTQATVAASLDAARSDTRKRILTMLNLDDTANNNLIATKLAEFQTLETARKPLQAEIDARQGVGFFDDPIQYLANATVLPGVINKHNAIARRQNEAIEQIDVAQKIAQAAENMAVGPTADQFARLGVATANEKVAEANAKAETARAEAASSTARKVLGIAHLTSELGGAALRSIQYELLAASRDETIAGKTELRTQRALLDNQLKVIGTTIGAQNVTFEQWKLMDPKTREEWSKRVRTGRLGDNISESVPFILSNGDLPTMARTGSAEIAQVVTGLENRARDRAGVLQLSAATSTGEKKPRDFYKPDAFKLVQEEIEGQRDGNMLTAPDNNPYKANHAAMATNWKGDPNNPVWKIVANATKNGLKVSDQILLDTVSKQVDAGQLTPAQSAAALTEYYSNVAARNNANRGLEMLGMGAEKNYIVLPKDAKMKVDLMRQASVENYMLGRFAARKALDEIQLGIPM